MIRLAVILLISLLAPKALADSANLRAEMQRLVSKGNAEYDRSNRRGITLYADSLRNLLVANEICGNDSVEFWGHWNKLVGDWYYENGNFEVESFPVSERYFMASLGLFDGASFLQGSLTASPVIHRELAQLYYRLGEYSKALEHTELALNAYQQAYELQEFDDTYNVDLYTTYLDLQAQLAMCHARTGLVEKALEEINALIDAFPKGSERYLETLRKKAKIVMLSGAGDCKVQALPLYREYLNFKQKDAIDGLAGMTRVEREDYWMRVRPFVADCYLLEEVDTGFLYDVTMFAKGLLLQLSQMSQQQAVNTLKYSWRQVQQRLRKDACAIEFVQYAMADGSQHLGALVLGKTGAPKWVYISAADSLSNRKVEGQPLAKRLQSTSGVYHTPIYADSLLASTIWNAQMVKAIGDAKRVYFAPDGMLHQLAIEYFTPEAIAEKELYRLTSTRRLLQPASTPRGAALLAGGVNYDQSAEETSSSINDAQAYDYLHKLNAKFTYLPGTQQECDSVVVARHCAQDIVLNGSDVTEEAFRSLCGQYPLVAISTHGYFAAPTAPMGTDIKPCYSDESLSQSVIALAGVNKSLNDNTFEAVNPDGLLSAKELSEIDMSGVDLAILSACQTGLGHVTADGVYGMQRGLKNAGVGAMVLSLWNVDDEATARLMSEFHKNLASGMTTHDAFVAARKEIPKITKTIRRKSYGTDRLRGDNIIHPFDEPQYTHAFILIDAIE